MKHNTCHRAGGTQNREDTKTKNYKNTRAPKMKYITHRSQNKNTLRLIKRGVLCTVAKQTEEDTSLKARERKETKQESLFKSRKQVCHETNKGT